MSKYSPGPWKWVDYRDVDSTWRMVDAGGDSVIRVTAQLCRFDMPDPGGPDARLIASAPEMLELLGEAYLSLHGHPAHVGLVAQIEVLIARIEGREP